MADSIRCPTCKKPVTTKGGEFPFCSERCRYVDLGRWFSEDYKVSRPMHPLLDGERDIPPELVDGWGDDDAGV